MKKAVIISILILITTILNGQNKSLLYTEEGKLIADSTISISVESLPSIIEIEKLILNQILEKIEYPKVCVYNYIIADLIVKLRIDSNYNIQVSDIGFKEIKIVEYFRDSIKQVYSFKEDPYIEKEILDLFNNKIVLKSENNISHTVLHIPFKFLMTKEITDKNFEDGCFVLKAIKVMTYYNNVESGGTVTD